MIRYSLATEPSIRLQQPLNDAKRKRNDCIDKIQVRNHSSTTTLLVHIPVRVTGTRVDIVETRPVQKAVREILSWVKSPLFCFVAWSLVDILSIGDQLLNLFPHSHADDIIITSAACLCY